MIISEVIEMLGEAMRKYGDVAVYVDVDYGIRPVERDDPPCCPSPEYYPADKIQEARIVI